VDADLHPASSRSFVKHGIEAATQTALPHVDNETRHSLARAESVSEKMDDQHLDVVARLATLEIEMSEIRKDLKTILATLRE
jgi:hypothetical protein